MPPDTFYRLRIHLNAFAYPAKGSYNTPPYPLAGFRGLDLGGRFTVRREGQSGEGWNEGGSLREGRKMKDRGRERKKRGREQTERGREGNFVALQIFLGAPTVIFQEIYKAVQRKSPVGLSVFELPNYRANAGNN